VGHLVIEEDQVGQAGPVFHEPMLAGSDPLVILHIPDEYEVSVKLLLLSCSLFPKGHASNFSAHAYFPLLD